MTRITLIASGTRGDVQPAIALGVGLRDAGYRVRILAGSTFRAWIEAHGLEAAPSRVDMQAVMASPAGRAWVQSGHRPLRQQRLMREIVDEHGADLIRDAADAAADADLLLSGFTSDAYALAIGEHRGIPVGLAAAPAHDAPDPRRAGDVGRAAAVAGEPGQRVVRAADPRAARLAPLRRGRQPVPARVGLPAQTAGQHLAQRRRMPMLHGVSRHVMPLPRRLAPDLPRDRLLVPGRGRGLGAAAGARGVPRRRPGAGGDRVREHDRRRSRRDVRAGPGGGAGGGRAGGAALGLGRV